MPVPYHPGQREVQDRFDTRRLADRLAEGSSDALSPEHAAFVAARDMFFIASSDEEGFPDCSYKGGDPGFVRVVDERTIAFPVYDGNGMFRTVGNLRVNPRVGLLFVDFEGGSRLRVNGRADVVFDGPLVDGFPGARCAVRVTVEHVFANCRRYVHEYRKVAASAFVPDADGQAPVPDWKRHPWFEGTLPAGDPALDEARPTQPAIPTF